MTSIDKQAERLRKASAYQNLVRSLATASQRVYRPTASSVFDALSRARLNERNAASSQLTRETLFGENPEASLPEELADKAISDYLANAGGLYGAAATDYILMSDPARAFKYFRKAAQHYRRAAQLAAEHDPELLRKSQEYQDQAAMVRQELARRRSRRLGFLPGLAGRILGRLLPIL